MLPRIRCWTAGLAVLLLAGVARAQKCPDVRLDNDATSSQAKGLRLAASGNNIFAVWADDVGRGFDLHFNRSLDGGATWLPSDVILNRATYPAGTTDRIEDPDIAVSGSNVYVVHEDERNGSRDDIFIQISNDSGTTWREVRLDTTLGGGIAEDESPRVAASGSAVYVVWFGDDNAPGTFDTDIFVNLSLDAGLSWFAVPIRLDTDLPAAADSFDPVIVASGTNVYVAWEDDRNGLRDIYFNRSLSSGAPGTWFSSDVRIDTGDPPGTNDSANPAIVASGSTVGVGWMEDRDGGPSNRDPFFNRSLDAGITWLAASTRLNTMTLPGAGTTSHVRLALSGTTVHALWDEVGTTRDVVYKRSTDSGTTFPSPEVVVNGVAGVADEPELAVVGQNVFFVWEDTRAANDIFFRCSQDGGVTFGTEFRINDPCGAPGSGATNEPSLAAGASSVFAAWEDGRNGGVDIFENLVLGYQTFCPGKPGCSGTVPSLIVSGWPKIGGSFNLDITHGLGGAPGWLVISRSNEPCGPPPQVGFPRETIPLPPLAGQGCGVGTGSFQVELGNDPSLIGVSLFGQMLFADDGAFRGFSATNPVEILPG